MIRQVVRASLLALLLGAALPAEAQQAAAPNTLRDFGQYGGSKCAAWNDAKRLSTEDPKGNKAIPRQILAAWASGVAFSTALAIFKETSRYPYATISDADFLATIDGICSANADQILGLAVPMALTKLSQKP